MKRRVLACAPEADIAFDTRRTIVILAPLVRIGYQLSSLTRTL